MAVYRLATDCPLYGAPLAVRHVRRTGAFFLGCTGYPACRFTEDYDTAFQSIASAVTNPPPRGIDPELLLGRLKELIAQIHPDRFGGSNAVATEATKLVLQLRDDVKAGCLHYGANNYARSAR